AWGPWSGAGMASQLGEAQRRRLATRGIALPDPAAYLGAFADLLAAHRTGRGHRAHVALFAIDWSAYLREFGASPPSLLAALSQLPTAAPAPSASLAAELLPLPAHERRARLVTHVEAQVAKVLELPASKRIDPKQRLFEFGLDSLTAVEVRNRLEAT